MIRPISRIRPAVLMNDYQVFKGECANTMRPFGQPVSLTLEAEMLIADDRNKLAHGAVALYAIHQRSENRITQIVKHRPVIVMPAPRPARKLAFPLSKAA